MNAQPLLSVRDLSKTFGGRPGLSSARDGKGVRAVDRVSFTIGRGEVLGLVGESGSGKTTVGRMVLRLVEPTAGTIEFDGVDLATLSRSQMRAKRRRMQIIFQDPFSSLNPHMKVGSALEEALRIHGLGGSKLDCARRVQELLGLVGLPASAAERYPHQFSGGQRQRIGIARALAVEPDLIIADEPVAALDVSVQAQVLNLLQDLQAKLGLSMLFIAHDLAVVQHVATRVMVMYLGRVMEVGPSADLFDEPLHPYTEALASAIPVPDPTRSREGRITLAGDIPSPINPPSGCVFRTRCIYAVEACAKTEPTLVEVRPGRFKACIRDDILSSDWKPAP